MKEIVATSSVQILNCDARDLIARLPNDFLDSCVTDGPYELGFMGKAWDSTGIVFDVSFWREVLRVLKPGAHLLSFGGTRTWHRMVCAVEDAGFEIRDSLHWFYGSGFPKSKTAASGMPDGQGTALKPGHEPIVMARKPLIGTLAENIAKYGTGGIQIDACRLATTDDPVKAHGRWPANVLLDECAAAELDEQSGECGSSLKRDYADQKSRGASSVYAANNTTRTVTTYADSGGASRFFYVAKPSRKERDLGCEHLMPKSGGEATDREEGSAGVRNPRAGAGRNGNVRNYHPTVKPVRLLRYLVRLVTPRGGTVFDPFVGSGTTGVAAVCEGAEFLGSEMTAEYGPIISGRLTAALDGKFSDLT